MRLIRLFLFIALTFGHFALHAQAVYVTLNDNTILDCSASNSIPAFCVHPDGTRYLINAFESFGHGISVSPKGELNNFVQLKEVKLDDQILYASGFFPGAGFPTTTPADADVVPPANPIPLPRSTHSLDHSTAMYVLSSLDSFSTSSDEVATKAFIEEIRQIANGNIESSLKNIYAKDIEIELEDGSKAECTNIKPSGETHCTMYHCKEPKVGYFVSSQFGSPSLITLKSGNQLESQISVKTVWNKSDHEKPISEALTLHPFDPISHIYAADSGLEQQMRRQSARQEPSLENRIDSSLKSLINPMTRIMFEETIKACDSAQIAPLIQGVNAARQEVADAQMVQLVEMANNVLSSRLINPNAIPDNACRDGDTWYRGQSYKFSRELLATSSPKTIDMQTATRLFNEARAMDDISWNYKADGCYARAHLMARRFEAQGIHVDKVWIKGDLRVPEAEIRWNFHVAPIVYVEDASGKVQKMVIDPSLMNGPVPVAQWSEKMEKGAIGSTIETNYPFPDNVISLERTAIAYSNSDPYLPYDQIAMSEEEKMRQSNETMERYLGYSQ